MKKAYGAGEITLCMKCLLCRHGDLDSDPRSQSS